MATGSQILFDTSDSLDNDGANPVGLNLTSSNNESTSFGKLTVLIELLTQRVENLASQVAGIMSRSPNVNASNFDKPRDIINRDNSGNNDRNKTANEALDSTSQCLNGPNQLPQQLQQQQLLNSELNVLPGSNDRVNRNLNFTLAASNNANGNNCNVRAIPLNRSGNINGNTYAARAGPSNGSDNFLIRSNSSINTGTVSPIPVLNDWLKEPNNLFNNNVEDMRHNDNVNSNDLANNLKTFDLKLFKFKKLQIEIQYLKECNIRQRVPKGLRQWRFPNGLVPHSQFHQDLLHLFDKQGLEFIDCLIKNYSEQLLCLENEVTVLDNAIRMDKNFPRYKFDFLHIFSSIDSSLEKIKENKVKKLSRDALAYTKGTVYPLPKTNVGNNKTVLSSGNIISTVDNVDPECSFQSVDVVHEQCEMSDNSPIRRSERIANKGTNIGVNNNNGNSRNNNSKIFFQAGGKRMVNNMYPDIRLRRRGRGNTRTRGRNDDSSYMPWFSSY
ncbi:putative uncharacterized protein DDB_G0286901 [Protopterus annectens]|uniref:putative uncharacterized protein DDB_G0286901 n=1 Tax=Protopterus annectens TaxID=7888 RepID=UPI001CF95E0C|nr:putative uncharacterized protein DDB_G0286901 [Protopterus annectens]